MLRHVAPQCIAPILVLITLNLGSAIFAKLQVLLTPPRIELRGERFLLLGWKHDLSCPAGNVADVGFEGPTLGVTFHSTSDVEPDDVRTSLDDQLSKMGCHAALNGRLFRREDIEELRLALGFPGLEAAAPRTPLGVFHRDLERRLPRARVTGALILVIAATLLVMTLSGVSPLIPDASDMVLWGANYGPRTLGGEPWRLLSSMFLHFGIAHAFFNVWVLWDVGRLLERLIGPWSFAVVYVLTGLAGSLLGVFVHPGVVSAGASGAVFGLFGALLGYSTWGGRAIPRAALRELRMSGISFLLVNLLLGLQMEAIDWAAHLGGLGCGLVFGVFLRLGAGLGQAALAWTMGTAGALALVAGVLAAPPPPDDYVAAFESFTESEARVLSHLRQAEEKVQRGAMTEAQFAETLEAEGLKPWIEMREQMARLKGAPGLVQRRLSRFLEYMDLRKEGWELVISGIRNHDQEALQQARKKLEGADRLVRDAASGK